MEIKINKQADINNDQILVHLLDDDYMIKRYNLNESDLLIFNNIINNFNSKKYYLISDSPFNLEFNIVDSNILDSELYTEIEFNSMSLFDRGLLTDFNSMIDRHIIKMRDDNNNVRY